jgi:Kef-type K+ transport system membrane component KefB
MTVGEVELLEALRHHVFVLPDLAKFAIVLAIIVGVPAALHRIRLPATVGLVIFGVILGPHGLEFFGENRPIADFFAELGKLLLMFSAGLEIDLDLFRKAEARSLLFGLITTSLPLVLGTVAFAALGYPLVPAIVIGSLLASHTLLGLSIVSDLGAIGLEPVIVTIGATVMSDTLSLIVFAVCVSTFTTGFSASGLAIQLVEIAIFVPLILFGLSRLGAYLIGKMQGSETAEFTVLLGIMAVAGVMAQFVNLPGIVGAFLAGLAVNGAAHDAPSKAKVDFIGKTLFIPSFFIVTGFLTDPVSFATTIAGNFEIIVAIIGSLLIGKWLAADLACRIYDYGPGTRLTMWALTMPQVAATLAAALVAHATVNPEGHPLLDGTTLNAVLVLMLTTSIVGPVLTERFAPQMMAEETQTGAAAVT